MTLYISIKCINPCISTIDVASWKHVHLGSISLSFSFLVLFALLPTFSFFFLTLTNALTELFSDLYLVCHVSFLHRSVQSENECSRGKPFGPCHARVTQKKGITMRHIGAKVTTRLPAHVLSVTSGL